MLQWVLVLPPKYKYPHRRKVNSLNSAHPAPLSVQSPSLWAARQCPRGKLLCSHLEHTAGWRNYSSLAWLPGI